MPRTNIGKPEAQLNIERELRQKYGNRLTKTDVAEYLGQSRWTVRKWMENIPAAEVIGSRKRYSPERVARAIYEMGEPGGFDS